jgi:hypothetical protein
LFLASSISNLGGELLTQFTVWALSLMAVVCVVGALLQSNFLPDKTEFVLRTVGLFAKGFGYVASNEWSQAKWLYRRDYLLLIVENDNRCSERRPFASPGL